MTRLLLGLLAALAGCLPDTDPGQLDFSPPPSCGNSRCELNLGESCLNCPSDCKCCAGILAAGNATSPENAVGVTDGKSAVLSAYQNLEITVGREVFDAPDQPDFELTGTVTGGGTSTPGCATVVPAAGVVVKVFDEKIWRTAGVWTSASPKPAAFDLKCAGVAHTSQIRLEALASTTANVDALKVKWKAEGGECKD